MVAVRRVQAAIVQVIDVITVSNRRMPALLPMHVAVIGMDLVLPHALFH